MADWTITEKGREPKGEPGGSKTWDLLVRTILIRPVERVDRPRIIITGEKKKSGGRVQERGKRP